jgi:hypothetical protein
MTERAACLLASRLLAIALSAWSLWTTSLSAERSSQGVQSGAPTPVNARWYDATNQLLSLAVMLDGGADEACAGAGFIAGHVQTSVFSRTLFVLTANHVVEGIERRAGLSQLGVRFRIVHDRSYRRKEPLERRLPASVTHRDATLDLAVLEIRDVDFVEAVQSSLDYEVLGDSAHLVVDDPLYGVGCGNGIDWDMPIEPAGVLPDAGRGEEIIAFEREYVREGFSGGPVAHIFDSRSTLVGMTVKVDGSRVLSRPIHVLLDRARAWGVPVLLIAAGTRLGCQYDVSPRVVNLSATRREALVNVNTAESCAWALRQQSDAALAERQKWWLDASVSKPSASRASIPGLSSVLTLGDMAGQGRPYYDDTGPGTVRIAAGSGSPCDGRPVHAVVSVAGQLVRIFFTGEC